MIYLYGIYVLDVVLRSHIPLQPPLLAQLGVFTVGWKIKA